MSINYFHIETCLLSSDLSRPGLIRDIREFEGRNCKSSIFFEFVFQPITGVRGPKTEKESFFSISVFNMNIIHPHDMLWIMYNGQITPGNHFGHAKPEAASDRVALCWRNRESSISTVEPMKADSVKGYLAVIQHNGSFWSTSRGVYGNFMETIWSCRYWNQTVS